MKSLAVSIVATMSLCEFLIHTMATDVACYVCEATNITACGNIIKIDIPGNDFVTCDSTTSTCYSFNVKDDTKHIGVLRGCGNSTNSTDVKACDLVPSQYKRDGDCYVCSTNNCNGGIIPNPNESVTPINGLSQVTGFAVKSALISSLVVARMFFQIK